MKTESSFFLPQRWGQLLAAALALLSLSACQSASTTSQVGPSQTGPYSGYTAGSVNRVYHYDSDVYLHVAVPVFNPGLPTNRQGNLDYAEVEKRDIWPQVRRLEANRFAVDTQRALQHTNAFSAVTVTPDSSASADLYVIGEIKHSDTETVALNIKVVDATNRVWGERDFQHRVSEGFYRDAYNRGKNSYDPIFKDIASYVFDLLNGYSDAEKLAIQQVAELRYAAMYSPETMDNYLERRQTRTGPRYQLIGFPAEEDPMLQRVRMIKAEDDAFIDGLQQNYAAFYADSDSSYLDYQRETLPMAVAVRRERDQRANRNVAAAFATVGAILLARNSNSVGGEIGSIVLAGTALYNLGGAIENNNNIRFQRQQISEMGQSLDIRVTPQVLEFNDQQIELTGTAREQYIQLRAQLRSIYDIEATPDIQL